MDFGNSIETVMHYFIIKKMICLNHRDEFHIVSALMCMIIHLIRLTVNRYMRLSIIMVRQVTILDVLSILKEY